MVYEPEVLVQHPVLFSQGHFFDRHSFNKLSFDRLSFDRLRMTVWASK